MNFVLFDDSTRNQLLPMTFTRPVADIRIGILTIREKWEKMLGTPTSTLTEDYLSEKFPLVREKDTILINGSILPDASLVESIRKLGINESLVTNDCIIAQHIDMDELESSPDGDSDTMNQIRYTGDFIRIGNTWEIFARNGDAMKLDFPLVTAGRSSMKLNATNTVVGNGQLFIEEGARINAAIFNTETGPIYIGKDAEVMEGSVIRGPFALLDHSVVKMGAKIYGPTTIGPWSKVGGELNNVVIFGYSNKAHDGFMGNSVIGEWCNIGADTNTSNLRNTYDEVKLWNYPYQTFVPTGLQFCGLIMGDHSKCGINTMFNTGTVVGVNSNIFGTGYQRNFIASFTWGGTQGFTTYDIEKAVAVAKRAYERRGMPFSDADEKILRQVQVFSFANRRL